ncbi:LuxR C-terminal-related transcriptional regulator [Ramlibacter sp. MMS24-I3-19]|uniref:LuxR C-terminal-related transcriptional regulator n=1 Tax=Ramlibacter sp. MMS24-I3-19 TaxID=3416606 RepID=UPI003D047755
METNTKRTIRVFVVAQAMVRWGLTRLIGNEEGFELAGEAETLESAGPLSNTRTDLLLVDIDGQAGDPVLHTCLPLMRQLAVLALSSADASALDWALMNGLRGVVRKSDQPATILKAIRKVHEGEIWLSRAAMQRILAQMWHRAILPVSDMDRARLATLTVREKEAITALTSDASAPCKVIADRLKISEHTLRNHLTSIYAKLDLRGRVDLYAFATRYDTQRGASDWGRNGNTNGNRNGDGDGAGPGFLHAPHAHSIQTQRQML